jgi:hypothetical protein
MGVSEPMDDRRNSEIRATYRALLLRGLEPGEAANVTAYLNGLPSAGIRWTVAEVEATVRRRADELRRTRNRHSNLPMASPMSSQTS